MAKPNSKAEADLKILKKTVETTTALITQLQTSAVPAQDAKKTDINALELAFDTASLIRAHSTKLSLLIINKPFTASAIAKILRELVAGPLPGLASAVELCDGARYTRAMSEELQYRAGKVFSELNTLVKAIPLDGQILSDAAKNGTAKGQGKGSLAQTGAIWEACDATIKLKSLGIGGLVIKKVEEYRALLKDALEELQGWGEEESDDEDDEVASEKDVDDAQAAVDDIFGSQRHIPPDDPERIRPRLESALKRLRLLILMYQAMVKRRFKTLPPLPCQELPLDLKGKSEADHELVTRLDEALDIMKKIPNITDEMASSFYELDGPEIDKRMDQCFFTGFAAAELLITNWEGGKDEFSTWAAKFQLAMKKGW